MDNCSECPEIIANIQSLLEVSSLPCLESKVCIYQLPKGLRDCNGEAQIPEIFPIGPSHQCSSGKKELEVYKWRYLKDFVSGNPAENIIQTCTKKLHEKSEYARGYYHKNPPYRTVDFVKMLVVDGCFLVVFILKSLEKESKGASHDSSDPILNTAWMRDGIQSDMLLLENQIPFFVLEFLFSQIKGSDNRSFLELAQNYMIKYCEGVGMDLSPINSPVVDGANHLLDLLLKCLVSSMEPPLKTNEKFAWVKTMPSVSELYLAGVKFRRRRDTCFMDVRFSNGVLEIPRLSIVRKTGPLLRNLMALEHYGHSVGYLTDYVTFMDNLIKSSSDVGLLRRFGIIQIINGDNISVFHLFCNLGQGKMTRLNTCYFSQVFDDVNAYHKTLLHVWHPQYYKVHWDVWQEILKRDYFNSPWKAMQFIGAVIILICTMIQTVCSVISLKRS